MSILVLDKAAQTYQKLVDTDWVFAADLQSAPSGFEIVLGQPDLVAAYIAAGNTPAWVQSTWAGVAPLIEQAKKQQVVVTGLKDVFGPSIAEYVFAHLLSRVQKLEEHLTSQQLCRWQPLVPDRINGSTMTIVGTGSIGCHLGKVASAFGLRVLGVSRSGLEMASFDACFPVTEIKIPLSTSDIVVLTLPDTSETRGLVGESVLKSIKPGATLINVGRGTVLDHEALLACLDSGDLSHAVLDVFPEEPLALDSLLWRHPSITVTPHVAAISHPQDVLAVFLSNLECYQNSIPLNHRIDLDRGY